MELEYSLPCSQEPANGPYLRNVEYRFLSGPNELLSYLHNAGLTDSLLSYLTTTHPLHTSYNVEWDGMMSG